MADNLNLEEEDDYAFSSLADNLGRDDSRGGPEDDGNNVNKTLAEERAKIKRLEDELAQQRELFNQSNSKIKTLDRLEKAFNPETEDERIAREREERIKNFDIDPLSGVDQIVSEKMTNLQNEISSLKSVRVAEKAMEEIDRDYDVDWGRNAQVIRDNMANLSAEYKSQNPKMAILKAAQMAGVLKRKEKMPHVLRPGATPAEIRKYQMTREEEYANSILRGKEGAMPKVLDELWGS